MCYELHFVQARSHIMYLMKLGIDMRCPQGGNVLKGTATQTEGAAELTGTISTGRVKLFTWC